MKMIPIIFLQKEKSNTIKNAKRSIGVIIAIAMIISLVSNTGRVNTVEAASGITTAMIDAVCKKYNYLPGYYWTYGSYNQNNPTVSTNSPKRNSGYVATKSPGYPTGVYGNYNGYVYNGAEECHGFALFLMSKVTNTNVNPNNGSKDGWKYLTKVDQLKVGDIVRMKSGEGGHTIVIYQVNNNGTFKCIEVWGGINNNISYGNAHPGEGSGYNTLKQIKKIGLVFVYRYEGNLPTTVISNANATNISSNGTKIECDVNPAKTIKIVQAAVWFSSDGDKAAQWYDAAEQNGKHYVFNMNVSKHNNKSGLYKANIHVFYTDGTKDMTASPITFTIPEPSIVHTHDYSINVSTTKEATCTEAGTKVMKCSCGSTMNVTIPKTGHNYVTVPQKEPTCVKYGLTSYQKCSKCGAVTFSTSIPPTGHTEVIDEAVPATCTTDGLTEGKHCSKCNAVIVEQQAIPKLGHDDEKYNTYPCSETQYYRCRRCGLETYHNGITISTKNHTIVIDPAVEPTYTTTGLAEGSHCSVCGKVIKEQEIIPMLNWNDDPDDKNDNYDYTDKYDDDTKDKQANYNSEKIDDKYIDKQNIEDNSNVEDKKNTTNDTNNPSINDNSVPVKKDNTQSVQRPTTEQPTTQQASITGPSEQSSPATKKTEVQKVKIPSKPSISIKNEKGKKLVVNWRKVNNAKGYQVEYALDKKFTKSKKSKTQKNLSFTAKNLKKTKVYYVRVRAYTLDSKGRKVYGKWSSTKKVKIKK